jgi:hypothetical protein
MTNSISVENAVKQGILHIMSHEELWFLFRNEPTFKPIKRYDSVAGELMLTGRDDPQQFDRTIILIKEDILIRVNKHSLNKGSFTYISEAPLKLFNIFRQDHHVIKLTRRSSNLLTRLLYPSYWKEVNKRLTNILT